MGLVSQDPRENEIGGVSPTNTDSSADHNRTLSPGGDSVETEDTQVPSTDTPPTETPPIGMERAASLVVVYTGEGKGKSSSAFGVMLRALALGWKVAVIQFLKSEEWKVGEEKIGRQLGVDWWALGDGFTWDSENMTETEAVARQAWEFSKGVIGQDEYRLVILDEVTYPINWGWIPIAEVVETITNRPTKTNVILTGRDAPAELLELADIATEMTKIKHAFDQGIIAKRGIDY